MSKNLTVGILNIILDIWNRGIDEVWSLLSENPESFKGGSIWSIVLNINGALQAVGYSLLILFFFMGVFKSASGFQDFKRPEAALRLFIPFLMAKTAITYGVEIMTTIFKICGGIVSQIGGGFGGVNAHLSLPGEIVDAIENVEFLASAPLFLVVLCGVILIITLSFKMLLTVYSRFFRLYMYTALAPIPLAAFGGEVTSGTGKAFIKSYIGVCFEGAIVILACIIYNAYAASTAPGLIDPGTSEIAIVITYLAETVFSLLVLVGLVSGADRLVKEMTAL